MTRIALALALLSLLPAAPAQTYRFPAGDGSISGSPLVPIWWQGKLALLSWGPWIAGGEHRFVTYDRQPSAPVIPPVSFHLVAAYAQDLRPCATGAMVSVHNYNDVNILNVGNLSPAGWVYWEGSVQVELDWKNWNRWVPYSERPFSLDYCEAPRTSCWSQCSQLMMGGGPGPQLCAVVLTID